MYSYIPSFVVKRLHSNARRRIICKFVLLLVYIISHTQEKDGLFIISRLI